jgi:hypothetical protein
VLSVPGPEVFTVYDIERVHVGCLQIKLYGAVTMCCSVECCSCQHGVCQ